MDNSFKTMNKMNGNNRFESNHRESLISVDSGDGFDLIECNMTESHVRRDNDDHHLVMDFNRHYNGFNQNSIQINRSQSSDLFHNKLFVPTVARESHFKPQMRPVLMSTLNAGNAFDDCIGINGNGINGNKNKMRALRSRNAMMGNSIMGNSIMGNSQLFNISSGFGVVEDGDCKGSSNDETTIIDFHKHKSFGQMSIAKGFEHLSINRENYENVPIEKSMMMLNKSLRDSIWMREYTENAPIGDSMMKFNVSRDLIWSSKCTESEETQKLDSIDLRAKMHHNSAKNKNPTYYWSGQLPRKVRTRNPIYSCKIFLGGIPYDLTTDDLHRAFNHFGNVQIQWPGKDVNSAIDGALARRAGYVYVVFGNYDDVSVLLNCCTVSTDKRDGTTKWYFSLSSRRCRGKEVQVIPFDIGDRFYMRGAYTGQMEFSRTVFVGALHGMLTADGLAKVMNDLFGGVVYAGLDTDKFKYPLGSGRVAFDNSESYFRAVSAAFIEIKSRFHKKIQIDPYIENDSMCGICNSPQNESIFCRSLECFRYYCRKCWNEYHDDASKRNHPLIIKNRGI